MKNNQIVLKLVGNRSANVICSVSGQTARLVVTVQGQPCMKKARKSTPGKPLHEFRKAYRAGFDEEIGRLSPTLPPRVHRNLRTGSEVGLDFQMFNGPEEASGFGANSARSSFGRYCDVSGQSHPAALAEETF